MGAWAASLALPSCSTSVRISFAEPVLHTQMERRYGINTPVVEFSVLSWVALLADSPIDPQKPGYLYTRLFNRLCADYLGSVGIFASLADDLIVSIVLSDEGQVTIPVFDERFKDTPVFREYLLFFRTGSLTCLRFLLSFLWFGKKAPYVERDFESNAFRDWLAVEDSIREDFPEALITNIKNVIGVLLENYLRDEFLPKHGPGFVSQKGIWGLQKKSLLLAFNEKQKSAFCGIRILGEANGSYPVDVLGKRECLYETSRLKFVPKNYKTARTICMEPATFMWTQQAVRRWVETSLSDGPLRGRVVLEDQTKNQYAALYGSKTGEVDTVDLSAASDSLAWSLVKRVFPTSVLIDFYATRSNTVELPDGRILPVRKFAPMGSALCFPAQSIVFAAVVIAATMSRIYRQDVTKSFPESAALQRSLIYSICDVDSYSSSRFDSLRPFQIYGDDITCDVRVTSNVVGALQLLGFKVNEGKTFRGRQAFRESCGEYYVNGISVTPFFLKFKSWKGSCIGPETLVSIIMLANKAFDFGYFTLNSFLVRFCLHYPLRGYVEHCQTKNWILFCEEPKGPFDLKSYNPYNPHLHVRFNPDLQRKEYLGYRLSPMRSVPIKPFFDGHRYIAWWRARYNDRGVGLSESEIVTVDTLGVGVRTGWTPFDR